MPILQVASDLHLELHRDGGTTFVNSMDPTGVDILALVGDIVSARFFTQVKDLFTRIAAKYPRVLYVPGNHELWRQRPEEALSVLYAAAEGLSNFTVMNNTILSTHGHRFLGGPMWFPQWHPRHDYAKTEMPDFSQIKDFHPWVTRENAKFQKFLKSNLKQGDVVLTHYLPSMQSVAPKYRGALTNPFFVSEMSPAISLRKPALWIHGHTHESLDYQLADTRIVCNPFGYPKELNPKYIDKLLIPLE